MTSGEPQTGYASINGLQLYYEIHGNGRSTLLLHGAYGTTGLWGELLPELAAGRQIIAVDPQGHGRTADIDRPIRYEAMADDCAALLDHLGIEQADVVGYSMGASTGLRLAIQHPARVRRQVLASASFRSTGMYPEILEQIQTITPELFAGTPYAEAYTAVAPRTEDFPRLVEKLKDLDAQPFDWTAEMASVPAPTLLIFGDADIVMPEHAVEMLRALGGGITVRCSMGAPRRSWRSCPTPPTRGCRCEPSCSSR